MVAVLRDKKSLADDLSRLDDVFDLIDSRREERHRIMAPSYLGLVKSYVDGHVRGELEVFVNVGTSKWKLTFYAVKDGIEARQLVREKSVVVNPDVTTEHDEWNELCVCRVAELIQGPEIVIPSLVWLESSKDFDNDIGYVLTDFSPANQVIEIIECIGDRELSALEPSIAREFRGGVGTLIKSGTGRLKNFDGQVCPTIWERRGELEFVGLGAMIRRVRLTDKSGWLFRAVFKDTRIQFGNLLFRAL
jgi:hypothetical protein